MAHGQPVDLLQDKMNGVSGPMEGKIISNHLPGPECRAESAKEIFSWHYQFASV